MTPQRRSPARCLALAASALLAVAAALAPLPYAAADQEHVIGVDDVLQIQVWEHKDLDREVTVRLDGKIALPHVGEVQASGHTASSVAETLTTRLSESLKNARVSVLVKEIRSLRVFILGQVPKPGVYPIKIGTPVMQALALAGGLTERADPSIAYIVRGDTRIPVDLQRLIQEADLSQNPSLLAEDTIVVPEMVARANPHEVRESRIYLLGKVQKPGVYTIRQEVPILHALFLAGGLADGADLGAAFVVRDQKRIGVDLRRLIQKGDVAQNITVRQEDTIVVPEGGEMQNSVFVMGEVTKPGAYPRTDSLTLLKLVSMAGGFTKFADRGRITLIRENGKGNGDAAGPPKTRLRVDLNAVERDPVRNPDPPLEAGDVIVVPQTWF